MSRPLAVLRPEPGNAATAARIEAAGHRAIRLPLFAVTPLTWTPPDPTEFDALLLTSANAVRHAGAGLAALRALPVIAVGEATAAAARAAGLMVAITGEGGVTDVIASAARYPRVLHLAGRHRTAIDTSIAATIEVYASDPLPLAPAQIAALAGSVALLHSARAARRFAELAPPDIAIAALSRGVADDAGPGWRAVAVADVPADAALIAAAARLAD